MLKLRLITGPILIIALLGLVWLDEWLGSRAGSDDPALRGVVLLTLGVIAVMFAGVEIATIARASGIRATSWLHSVAPAATLITLFGVLAGWIGGSGPMAVATAMVAIFVLSLLVYCKGQRVDGVLPAAGGVLLSSVYLGLMLGFLLALRLEHSAWWIVGVVLTAKACDTGAYFTGHAIGRHKMIPWLSPGKTWEGLAGGIVTAGVVGLLMALASRAWLGSGDQIQPAWGVLCGVVFAVVGQLGDLAMSLFKRGGGVKDSSNVLPGLGGVMDVLDSPLMVAPVAYWLLQRAGS